ncbi:hypothetical protein QCM80_44460 [Bradyrhizobium sp. SSUT112]|uniref:hypothetical protein n=1 Tax=Bradyrhizobium sp. SSUT112 TaxID=3040604 RepID=UPI00244AEB5A|nr:hypothetical protein [Bradyrhizobium sp. SSUT112]MDH2357539.1 hypothetical protein [Bradyrhizobium sp. SSUT112]
MELDDHRFVVAYTAYRDEKNVFAAGFTHLFGAILLQTIQAGPEREPVELVHGWAVKRSDA